MCFRWLCRISVRCTSGGTCGRHLERVRRTCSTCPDASKGSRPSTESPAAITRSPPWFGFPLLLLWSTSSRQGSSSKTLVSQQVPGPTSYFCSPGFGVVEGYIGRACSWGRGSDGKLGHGAGGLTQSKLDTPFPIYGPLHNYSITVVACGQDHSGCITDDGKIFTWGSNKEGQLGLNDYKPRPQPTPIETVTSF